MKNHRSGDAFLRAYSGEKLVVVQMLKSYGNVDCNGNPVKYAIINIKDEYPEVDKIEIVLDEES